MWAFSWNFSIPIHALAIGIGLTCGIAGLAAILFLGRGEHRMAKELFTVFCPILTAAFWGYAWYSWYPEPYRITALIITLHAVLGAASVGAVAAVWRMWSRGGRQRVGAWLPAIATVSVLAVSSTLFISKGISFGPGWQVLLIAGVPASVAIAAFVPWIVARKRLSAGERPSYLGILKPALAICLAWMLVLQVGALVWLGAWRAKAAAEIERAYSVSENQAVLRIMEEARKGQ